MLTLTGATKLILAQSTEELLHHIASKLIPDGFIYWVAIHTPEEVDEFDKKVINTIETERWKARGEHFPEIKFLRSDRTCVLMAKEIPLRLIHPSDANDIRQTPIEVNGFRLSTHKTEGGLLTSIEKIKYEMPSWMYPTDTDYPQ